MAYVTVADLKNYTRRFPAEGEDAMLQGFVDSAMETVQNYLGYSIADFSEGYGTLRSVVVEGDGSGTVQLPVASSGIYGVCKKTDSQGLPDSSDPQESWTEDWSHAVGKWLKDSLHVVEHPEGEVFTRGVWYEILYIPAFWPEVPEKIRTVTLELASLYWEASGGNLAVTSTSYGDQGTRVFQNFTAEERYLKQLEAWKINKAHVSRWRLA